MLGGIILLVSLISWFGKANLQKAVFIGALFGLAMASQMQTVNKYRLNWDIQRNFYWQMDWRIPALKPGTTLLAPMMPFNLVAEYSVAFAFNTIYAPQQNTTDVSYWFFSAYRYIGGVIPALQPGLPITYKLRTINVNGSTSQSLVIDHRFQQACARVMGPQDNLSPMLSSNDVALLGISNLDQVIYDPQTPIQPPADIFGPEPQHTWCYYYQKADLASQFEDWPAVVKLGDEANQQGYTAILGTEWIPFIKGYAHSGDWSTAVNLTQQATELTGELSPYLCSVWQTIDQTTGASPEKDQAFVKMNKLLACSPQ